MSSEGLEEPAYQHNLASLQCWHTQSSVVDEVSNHKSDQAPLDTCESTCKELLLHMQYQNFMSLHIQSELFLSGHSKRAKIGFHDQLLLNAGQKYCRMLKGEHFAILLPFIKLPFVIQILVLSIFEWPIKTSFTVHVHYLSVCALRAIIT